MYCPHLLAVSFANLIFFYKCYLDDNVGVGKAVLLVAGAEEVAHGAGHTKGLVHAVICTDLFRCYSYKIP